MLPVYSCCTNYKRKGERNILFFEHEDIFLPFVNLSCSQFPAHVCAFICAFTRTRTCVRTYLRRTQKSLYMYGKYRDRSGNPPLKRISKLKNRGIGRFGPSADGHFHKKMTQGNIFGKRYNFYSIDPV